MAETDYRAICLELFGTDDVEKLKMIAKQIRQKNTRHAGRKRKFNETETEEMKRLQRAGMTVNAIARRFGTSRQVIGEISQCAAVGRLYHAYDLYVPAPALHHD